MQLDFYLTTEYPWSYIHVLQYVHVQGQGLQNMPDVSVMLYLFLQKVFGDFQNSELSITSCKFILPATEHFRTI